MENFFSRRICLLTSWACTIEFTSYVIKVVYITAVLCKVTKLLDNHQTAVFESILRSLTVNNHWNVERIARNSRRVTSLRMCDREGISHWSHSHVTVTMRLIYSMKYFTSYGRLQAINDFRSSKDKRQIKPPPPKVMDSDQNSVNPEKIMEETLANFVKPYQSLKAPSSRHGARDIFVRRDI